MKTILFKKNVFLILFMLLCSVTSVSADNDGLITQQITLKLDAPGTLPDRIGSSVKYKITNLKIVGEINGKDWSMIRDMAGGRYNINETSPGKLSKLDLSEAVMVEDFKYSYANDGDNELYVANKETIPACIFNNCSSLQEIIIPSYIKSIGSFAFNGSGLTSFIFPSSINTIGDYAFYGCSGLTSLTIPSSITEIASHAFSGCSGLTSVTIPSSVTEIGDYAFAYCI